jgi:Tfp pilus assembly protein PilE
VELLIVVAALAIMAGIVIPQVTDALDDARHASMLSHLHALTTAIERYRIDHNGDPPDDLTGHTLAQLTASTDSYGNAGVGAGFVYGPYLKTSLPENPLNHSAEVFRSATSPPANLDQRVGWVYYPENGQIWGGLARDAGGW